MIVPDVNLLVYAYNSDAPQHEAARAWWEDSLSGREPVGLTWAAMLGFVRLMTHSAVLVDPMTPGEALSHVRSWLARPNATVLQPGPRHLDLLDALFDEAGVAGTLTTDAHLAAIALENNATLHSNDADFARFGGLRHRNPAK